MTLIRADGLGLRGASPESDRSSPGPFLLFLLAGFDMELSMPYRSFFLSPTASSEESSLGSVGSNMQKMTDSSAASIESTTVSIETRWFFGSGEKKTRTFALPTAMSSDHFAPLAVSGTEGSPVSSF